MSTADGRLRTRVTVDQHRIGDAAGGRPRCARGSLQRRCLGSRLRRRLRLRPRVDAAPERYDEQGQADDGRRDQHEPERICGTPISDRTVHGRNPSTGTASTTTTWADVPRIIPGARPGDAGVTTSPSETSTVTAAAVRSVSAAQHRRRRSRRVVGIGVAPGDERSTVAGDHSCFGSGMRPQRGLEGHERDDHEDGRQQHRGERRRPDVDRRRSRVPFGFMPGDPPSGRGGRRDRVVGLVLDLRPQHAERSQRR